MNLRIVISGRAYHTTESLPDQIELSEGASVDDALAIITGLLPEDQQLPASCLIAVGNKHLGTLGNHPATSLAEGDELVIISPVAGG